MPYQPTPAPERFFADKVLPPTRPNLFVGFPTIAQFIFGPR